MKGQVSKVAPGTGCKREVRLDPAGRPVYCPSKAVMAIDGTPLCQKHSQETMMAIAVKKTG
jgi:hypothetical protein